MLPLSLNIAQIRLLILAAFCIGVMACAVVEPNPSCLEDGREIRVKPYIAFDVADEYYERGIAYAAFNGCLDQAIEDFKRAIERKGTDQWRLRIRGDWPIDYFPNRELGIAYYHVGRFSQAEKALLESLQGAHSERAVYFLDRTRRAIVQEVNRRSTNPVVQISWDSKTHWTNENLVVLTGSVSDVNYISELTINGQPEYLIGNPPSHRFRKVFPELSQGTHDITIRAVNLVGRETIRKATVHVDRQGPIIDLEKTRHLIAESGERIELRTTLMDDAGLEKMEINGKIVAHLQGHRQTVVRQLGIDELPATLVVSDQLGNKTRTVVPLSSEQTPSTSGGILLASSNTYGISAQIAGNSSSGIQLHLMDYLKNVGTEALNVYQLEIPIPLEFEAGTEGIQSVKLTVDDACIEKKQGFDTCPKETNSRSVPVHGKLDEGKRRLDVRLRLVRNPCCRISQHTILVEAKGQKGNSLQRQVQLLSMVPEALDFSRRIVIRIAASTAKDTGFLEHLGKALMDTGRFIVVHQPSGSDASGTSPWQLSNFKSRDWYGDTEYSAVLAGRLIIQGTPMLIRCGNPSLYMVGAQEKPAEIKAAAEFFAQRILLEFPLLQGRITSVQKEGLLYQSDISYVRALAGRKLNILAHRTNSDPTDYPKPIAQAFIESIDLKAAKIRVINGLEDTAIIKINDQVVTNYY
jgi:hypothetical protein